MEVSILIKYHCSRYMAVKNKFRCAQSLHCIIGKEMIFLANSILHNGSYPYSWWRSRLIAQFLKIIVLLVPYQFPLNRCLPLELLISGAENTKRQLLNCRSSLSRVHHLTLLHYSWGFKFFFVEDT